MLTILFYMTVKAGREESSAALVKEATASTRAEDDGCINYTFYRRSDNPRELVLFEQWRDAESLGRHIARLQRVYGPPDDTEPHPPTHHRRRLPKAFLDHFEKTEAVRYDTID
jgi:quinol monooxygenase YgiN